MTVTATANSAEGDTTDAATGNCWECGGPCLNYAGTTHVTALAEIPQ